MAIKAQGYTQAEFARLLGVAPSTLTNALSGITPMTKALHNHIALLLSQPRDAVITYRINIPDEKVEEICCDCRTEEERQAAIKALIHHNLAQLAALGAILSLNPDESKYLGLN